MASAPTAPDATGALELRGLRRSFGEIAAADGLSLSVPAGCVFGFVGRSGAGKTTMWIVCGLLAADREPRDVGWRADRRARARTDRQRSRGARPVGDDAGRGSARVLRGARWGDPQQARRAACSWLQRLGLGARERVRVKELSHGTQRRAQLAAASVHSPDLLSLDERFAGLDPIATDMMGTATDFRGATPPATSISNIQAASIAS